MATAITVNLVAGEGLESAASLVRAFADIEIKEAYDTLGGGIGGGTSPINYYMRAWNLNTVDWETWRSVGSPVVTPPSGDPITALTISARGE